NPNVTPDKTSLLSACRDGNKRLLRLSDARRHSTPLDQFGRGHGTACSKAPPVAPAVRPRDGTISSIPPAPSRGPPDRLRSHRGSPGQANIASPPIPKARPVRRV